MFKSNLRLLACILLTLFVGISSIWAYPLSEATLKQIENENENLEVPANHFYKIKHNGKTTYLFGTYHVFVRLKHYPSGVKEAFESSTAVAIEIQMVDSEENAKEELYNKFELDLKDFTEIKSEARERVNSGEMTRERWAKLYLKLPLVRQGMLNYGFPEPFVDLIPLELPIDYNYLWPKATFAKVQLDTELNALGLLAKKEMYYLENDEVREQALQHESTVNSQNDDSDEVTLESFIFLQINDPARIREFRKYFLNSFQNAFYLSREDRHILVDQENDLSIAYRNKHWMPQIQNMIQNEDAFIAVGVNHLYGKQGLIRLLEAEGYKVEPVFNFVGTEANSEKSP